MLLLASNQTSIEFPVFWVLISPHPDDVLGTADGAGDAVPDSAGACEAKVGGEPDLRIFTSKFQNSPSVWHSEIIVSMCGVLEAMYLQAIPTVGLFLHI